jgi:CO dehydrogenase/acetyl-CoA synthase delta subunit
VYCDLLIAMLIAVMIAATDVQKVSFELAHRLRQSYDEVVEEPCRVTTTEIDTFNVMWYQIVYFSYSIRVL